jgi:hypothetical protein
MPVLSQPLAEVTPADLESLITEGRVEDELLEFKRTLATSKGDPDRWIVDQSEIGMTAKRDVLAEVIAMANSYGGDVILGVDETEEKPPRAQALIRLPRCVDLAHRLQMAARDLIKPEIPMLTVRGVPLEGEAGVVLFRVPRSREAPHRLEIKGMEKECYKRVSDRTEVMSMREIRDLTFAVASGLDKLSSRLSELTAEFQRWSWNYDRQDKRHFAYCIAATPMSADLYLERVHDAEEVRPRSSRREILVNDDRVVLAPIASQFDRWRPILRGTQAESCAGNSDRLSRLYCDGAVSDMSRRISPAADPPGQREAYQFYPGWYFGTILDAFSNIERYRRAAGAQSVQYALDLTIAASAPLPVLGIGSERLGRIEEGSHSFPRYQVGEVDTWNELLTLIWRDMWHFLGVDPRGETLKLPENMPAPR